MEIKLSVVVITIIVLLKETYMLRQNSSIMSLLLSLMSLAFSHPNICYESEIFFVIYTGNVTNSPMHAVVIS